MCYFVDRRFVYEGNDPRNHTKGIRNHTKQITTSEDPEVIAKLYFLNLKLETSEKPCALQIAALRLEFPRACWLQPSEQNTWAVAPPPTARAEGTQVPHTLQRTSFSCACGFRLNGVPDLGAPDRICCTARMKPCAIRRYGNNRRNTSASKSPITTAKIKYFKFVSGITSLSVQLNTKTNRWQVEPAWSLKESSVS